MQNRAIRFVDLRHGITESRTALGLAELKDRRESHRFALITTILSEDEKHSVLSSVYSEIVIDRNQLSMTARAAARREPTTVYTKSHAYYIGTTGVTFTYYKLFTKIHQRYKNRSTKVRLEKC